MLPISVLAILVGFCGLFWHRTC